MSLVHIKIIGHLLLVIPVLVAVAFVTLLERKILGLSQLRKGPNKVAFLGIFQPFRDAIKLFSNERFSPRLAGNGIFMVSPALSIIIMLLIYLTVPYQEQLFSSRLGLIFLYTLLRLNVYPVLLAGWISNSRYALIGGLRRVAQTISYEVRLALVFLFFFTLIGRFRLLESRLYETAWLKGIIFIPLVGVWLISCLAETNRTPFDFAEGESELVSGFNVEYGRLGFAVIFMAEYGIILFISFLFSYVFLSPDTVRGVLYLCVGRVAFIWVWVRTTFPRYRYDKLINLTWKVYLPVALLILWYALNLIT